MFCIMEISVKRGRTSRGITNFCIQFFTDVRVSGEERECYRYRGFKLPKYGAVAGTLTMGITVQQYASGTHN
jgi:hypothetical protein